jgi:hypothetical protein
VLSSSLSAAAAAEEEEEDHHHHHHHHHHESTDGGDMISLLQEVVNMGFSKQWGQFAFALQQHKNEELSLEKAMSFILEHIHEMDMLCNDGEGAASNNSSNNNDNNNNNADADDNGGMRHANLTYKECVNCNHLIIVSDIDCMEEGGGELWCTNCGQPLPTPQELSICKDYNVSLEMAKQILKEQEKLDYEMASRLREPKVECMVCMEEFYVSDCFTVDCHKAHRFCFACIKRHVEVSLNDKKMATCLHCPYHLISQVFHFTCQKKKKTVSLHISLHRTR